MIYRRRGAHRIEDDERDGRPLQPISRSSRKTHPTEGTDCRIEAHEDAKSPSGQPRERDHVQGIRKRGGQNADPQSEQQDRAREDGGRGLQARDPTHYASGLHGAMNSTAAASGPRTPVSALSASLADCPRTIRGAHVRHKDPLRQ
jgi:hypothetical protein